MLTRALDEILRAADGLPQHLAAAQRGFGHDPNAVQACERLAAALAETRAALVPPGEARRCSETGTVRFSAD